MPRPQQAVFRAAPLPALVFALPTSRVHRARAAVEMSHPAPTRRAPGRAKRDFRAKGENIATLRPSYGIARAAPPPAELPALPLGKPEGPRLLACRATVQPGVC